MREGLIDDLLHDGILSRVEPSQELVWVFNEREETRSKLTQRGCSLLREGQLDPQALLRLTGQSPPEGSIAHIFHVYLSSVEALANHQLTTCCKAVLLKPMTWILPVQFSETPQGELDTSLDESQHLVVSLRVQIGANGNLVLLPQIRPAELKPLIHGPSKTLADLIGLEVIIAPSGKQARVVNEPMLGNSQDTDRSAGSNEQSQRHQARARLLQRSKFDAWKSLVLKELRGAGQKPPEQSDPAFSNSWLWIELYHSRRNDNTAENGSKPTIVPWPAVFCFTNPASTEELLPSRLVNPIFTTDQDYQNPLSSAEQWYLGAPHRYEVTTLAQPATTTAARADGDRAGGSEDQDLAASPLYQRNLELAAAGGMYPTPPDGVVPGVSSDAVVPPTNSADPQSDSLDAAESDELRGQQSRESSVGFDVDHFANDNNEDLFGDLDEDMFDGPNVTDADFSFFDDGAGQSFPPTKGDGTDITSVVPLHDVQETTLPGGLATVESPSRSIFDSSLAASAPVVSEIATTPDQIISQESSLPPKVMEEDVDQKLGEAEDDRATFVDGNDHAGIGDVKVAPQITPPLSPFAIKERLLPLPVPASALRAPSDFGPSLRPRTYSNFGAVTFNNDIDSFNAKYGSLGRFGRKLPKGTTNMAAEDDTADDESASMNTRRASIALPRKPKMPWKDVGNRSKKPRSAQSALSLRGPTTSGNKEGFREFASNDGSSDDLTSSEDDAQIPPNTPRKRKRDGRDSVVDLPERGDDELLSEVDEASAVLEHDHCLLDKTSLVASSLVRELETQSPEEGIEQSDGIPQASSRHAISTDDCASLWDIFDFGANDMIAVAQLVQGQGNTLFKPGSAQVKSTAALIERDQSEPSDGRLSEMRGVLRSVFDTVLDGVSECTFPGLASMSMSMTSSNNDQSAKGQPRPIPRRSSSLGGTSAYGQHLFPIGAPFVRMRRADSTWDMMASAIDFWEPLGLEPNSGPKDMTVYAVLVGNDDLVEAVSNYILEIGTVYESCKLGSHTMGTQAQSHGDSDCVVSAPMPSRPTLTSVLSALHAACLVLAEHLIKAVSNDPNNITMIYLVSPFDDPSMIKFVCACFWTIYREFYESDSYEDNHGQRQIVLQILPVGSIALPDVLTISDNATMTRLARAVYDRCPLLEPSRDAMWRIPCAPSIEIVSPLTRKINFMLNDKTPNNLLQEAQTLHLAYNISSDTEWVTAAWTDYTGRQQYSSSFCLSGANEQGLLAEIRNLTRSMMTDKAMWRLFVAKIGSLNDVERKIWRELAGSNVAVTMLDIDICSPIEIIPPGDNGDASIHVTQPGAGFITPATTPQASSSQTVSPDAHGAAPPTPAASEPLADNIPPDPDSHLLDTRDESWALILPFSATRSSSSYRPKRVLASGLLIKRAEQTGQRPLPTLGVDVVETLPPVVQSGQPSWLMPRSAEGVLREVLSGYRGLALLAKLRGLRGAEAGVVPWHVATALNGSESLVGFFG